jgi:RHS repeat-associated protein
MQWDFKDQLQASSQQVVNNGGTPETTYYVYDAAGQRVRKVTERFQPDPNQEPTRRKERLYLGSFEVYREYNGGGGNVTLERETLHVMDDQQRIAQIDTRTQGNDDAPAQSRRFQLSNHLGSAMLEVDEQANVISYEEYHPYGTSAYRAGRSAAEVSLKRYCYIGKECDGETGLYYHGARYYAPWLGRWISSDPTGIWDGMVRYSFLRGNPIKFVDRTGKYSEPPEEQPQPRPDDVFRPDKVLREIVQQGSQAVLKRTREAVKSVLETVDEVETKLEELGKKITQVETSPPTAEAAGTKDKPKRRTRLPKAFDIHQKAPGVTVSETGTVNDEVKKHLGDSSVFRNYEGETVTGGSDWVQVKESPGIKLRKGKYKGEDRTKRQWALDPVAADLKKIGEMWHKRHPDNPIRISDISREGGGKMDPHTSHQKGVDVDIGFVRTDPKAPRGLEYDNPKSKYSEDLTRELMELILEESTLGIQYIFFADDFVEELEGGVGLSRKSNKIHAKHFHVRFGEPSEVLPEHLK